MKNKYWLLRTIGRMSFIPFGIRIRLVELFVKGSNKSSRPFQIPFYGFKYAGDLNTYVDWCVFFFGAYEKGFLTMLKDIAVQIKDPVFIDIGANVGQHSLFMAAYAKKIHSFEPNKISYDRVIEKGEMNHLGDRLTVHPYGLSNTPGMLDFYIPNMTNTGSASFEDRSSWGHTRQQAEVKVGDDVFAAVKPEKIDIIKIDVEGFEKNVIDGLQQTLAQYRPLIIMEFEQMTIDKFGTEENFKKSFPGGYRFFKVYGSERNYYAIKDFAYMYDGGSGMLAVPEEKLFLIGKNK